MKALCISQEPCRQMHKFLRIISALGKDLMVTLSISMTIIMVTILMTRFSLPKSGEDPHGGLNKLNKEEAGSEIRGKVEQTVSVLEQVRHTWS